MKKKIVGLVLVVVVALSGIGGVFAYNSDNGDRENIREKIIEIANEAEGTSYVFGGSDLEEGVDASGFVASVYAEAGILDSEKAENHYYSIAVLETLGKETDTPETGDIICYEGHVAIYLNETHIIEAVTTGVRIYECDPLNVYGGAVTVRNLVDYNENFINKIISQIKELFTGTAEEVSERLAKVDGELYWYGSNGEIQIGWYNDIYYFDPYALTGFQTIDGETYYFNEYGVKQTGFVEVDGSTYYFDDTMKTGIVTVDDKKYYFDEDGVMQTGFITVDGDTYYFGDFAVSGLSEVDNQTYYFNEDGVMQTGIVDVNGTYYYFDDYMKYGLAEVDGNIYYFNEGGMVTESLEEIDGETYYFTEDGTALVSDSITISGYVYKFGSDGTLTSKTSSTSSKNSSSSSASSTKSSSSSSASSTKSSSSSSSSTKSSSSSSSSTKSSSSSSTSSTESGSEETYSYKTKVGSISFNGYTANLYVAASTDYYQDVVDDENSALVYGKIFYGHDASGIHISDHAGDGFRVLADAEVGSTAYVTLYGTTYTLTCVTVMRHAAIADDVAYYNMISMRTCESDGNGKVVTFWECSSMDIVDLSYRLRNEY